MSASPCPPMANKSAYEHLYRCAIISNNIGVALMKKGCFSQALDTIRDSVVIMRQVYCQDRTFSDYELQLTSHHIALAEARLRNPVRDARTAKTEVMFLQDTEYSDIESHLASFFSQQRSFVAIHLDVVEVDLENHSIDFDSAVLLYNLALAHVGISDTYYVSMYESANLLQAALKLFQYTHTLVLNELHRNSPSSVGCKFLGAFVMGSFSSILDMQGRNYEAFVAASNLNNFVQTLNKELSVVVHRCAPAA